MCLLPSAESPGWTTPTTRTEVLQPTQLSEVPGSEAIAVKFNPAVEIIPESTSYLSYLPNLTCSSRVKESRQAFAPPLFEADLPPARFPPRSILTSRLRCSGVSQAEKLADALYLLEQANVNLEEELQGLKKATRIGSRQCNASLDRIWRLNVFRNKLRRSRPPLSRKQQETRLFRAQYIQEHTSNLARLAKIPGYETGSDLLEGEILKEKLPTLPDPSSINRRPRTLINQVNKLLASEPLLFARAAIIQEVNATLCRYSTNLLSEGLYRESIVENHGKIQSLKLQENRWKRRISAALQWGSSGQRGDSSSLEWIQDDLDALGLSKLQHS